MRLANTSLIPLYAGFVVVLTSVSQLARTGTIMWGCSETFVMTEKLTINGQDVWVVVEALDAQSGHPNVIPTEYFIAYYNFQEPGIAASSHEPGKMPGELFEAEDGSPKRFLSPVEAIEYAAEKLPVLIH